MQIPMPRGRNSYRRRGWLYVLRVVRGCMVSPSLKNGWQIKRATVKLELTRFYVSLWNIVRKKRGWIARFVKKYRVFSSFLRACDIARIIFSNFPNLVVNGQFYSRHNFTFITHQQSRDFISLVSSLFTSWIVREKRERITSGLSAALRN